ncbi:unnamed protein product [Blepharisma stoltei]|uniref:F-box domain-containing protein n=1 Tax=Blepharisma stoltei TaxID=1481888 RepID=A0AAU9KG79_9CILI|nr:unnamed protein product [Blepharisma stoltei]
MASEQKASLQCLSLNLLTEISEYLLPLDIVSLLGVCKRLHSFWTSKLAYKTILNPPYFNLTVRESWLLLQIKYLSERKNYPEIQRIGSLKMIYVLDISYSPLVLTLFLDKNLSKWKPYKNNRYKIIKNLETNFSVHSLAYHNGHLCILYTNNMLRCLLNSEILLNIENFEINYLNVLKMFYLNNAEYLVLFLNSGWVVFMNNQCEIISNRKIGTISEYKVIKNDIFIACVYNEVIAISPNKVQKLCVFKDIVSPNIFINKESQKIIIGISKNVETQFQHKSIQIAKKGKYYADIERRLFFQKINNRSCVSVVDEKTNKKYRFKAAREVASIFGDKRMILVAVNHWENRQTSLLFYLWEDGSPIFTKDFDKNINVLGFEFPYVIYSYTSDIMIEEIHVMKL